MGDTEDLEQYSTLRQSSDVAELTSRIVGSVLSIERMHACTIDACETASWWVKEVS